VIEFGGCCVAFPNVSLALDPSLPWRRGPSRSPCRGEGDVLPPPPCSEGKILAPLPACGERVPAGRVRGVAASEPKETNARSIICPAQGQLLMSQGQVRPSNIPEITSEKLARDAFRARHPRLNCNDRDRRDMMEVCRKAGRATAIRIASVEELSTPCHFSTLARTRTSRSLPSRAPLASTIFAIPRSATDFTNSSPPATNHFSLSTSPKSTTFPVQASPSSWASNAASKPKAARSLSSTSNLSSAISSPS
jgi:hypothetical protein